MVFKIRIDDVEGGREAGIFGDDLALGLQPVCSGHYKRLKDKLGAGEIFGNLGFDVVRDKSLKNNEREARDDDDDPKSEKQHLPAKTFKRADHHVSTRNLRGWADRRKRSPSETGFRGRGARMRARRCQEVCWAG